MALRMNVQARLDHRFAATYNRFMAAAERRWAYESRGQLLSGLTGRVLEVGAGTGVNIPHYKNADHVVLVEPWPAMRSQLHQKVARDARVATTVVDAVVEDLPFPGASFDAVVCTFVLCSVEDSYAALAEIQRVLRPGGTLAFLEHVRGGWLASRVQDLLTPVIRRFAAGCHPNRDTEGDIERAGFTVLQSETLKPLPVVPWFAPFVKGAASPADHP
ncbi:methyltransferase domain-containing protein [Streptomyces sp. NBC_01077]|uniref:class I SAM-dependent methyltransferase n=1 Tax=Streptomyces sp. NBC_01077 TaxID=2903746 RepID=UPI00386CB277|nr:methyltransferase domain-containing protein [Streptomyces sp. NBC_01077]WSV43617.1 methyltransferase domain-containing protein [Streptomyces sp. NBC_01077]